MIYREPYQSGITTSKQWLDEWKTRMEEHEKERLLREIYIDPRFYAVTPKPKPVLKRQRKKPPSNDRLKAFLEAKKVDTVVLGDVARHLQSVSDDRDTLLIHPSEMAKKDWCVRGTLLRIRGYTRPKEVHRLRSELIFAEGRAIHEKWQTWFADMGILYGSWYCPACQTRILGEVLELPTRGCEGQVDGMHLWKYREVPLEDKALNVGGHADGIILRPDQDYLIEAKSIGPGTLRKLGLLSEEESDEDTPDKFSRITHIYGDHFRQTQIYLRLSQKTDRPVNKGLVLYENKADQQVREFVVDYDPDVTKNLFDIAEDIVWAFKNGRELACSNAPIVGECNECRGWEAP